MRHKIKTLLLAVIVFLSLPAFAADNLTWTNNPPDPNVGQRGFSLAGQTNSVAGASRSWAIVPVPTQYQPGGAAVISSFSAFGDAATSQLISYFTGAPTQVAYTNSTTTIYVVNTNGFGPAMPLIIRHVISNVYERSAVSSFVGSTNIVVGVAPKFEVDPGDMIYPCQQGAAITVGSATVTRDNPRGIFWGRVDGLGNTLPMLFDVTGTSNPVLQQLSGYYDHN